MNKYTRISFYIFLGLAIFLLLYFGYIYFLEEQKEQNKSLLSNSNSQPKNIPDSESDNLEKLRKLEEYRISTELRANKTRQFQYYKLDYSKIFNYWNEYYEKSDLTREEYLSGVRSSGFPDNPYDSIGSNGAWDILDGTYIILKPNSNCEKLKKVLNIADPSIKYSESVDFENKDWCHGKNLGKTGDSILVFFSFTGAEELERYVAAKSFLKMHTTLISSVDEAWTLAL
ncbi:hypothetical protein KBC86_03615 [Candidatus Gracilibacteria bacterium]|nr:hypothetical protein [Candidatus Gracilibacteria bacterium]